MEADEREVGRTRPAISLWPPRSRTMASGSRRTAATRHPELAASRGLDVAADGSRDHDQVMVSVRHDRRLTSRRWPVRDDRKGRLGPKTTLSGTLRRSDSSRGCSPEEQPAGDRSSRENPARPLVKSLPGLWTATNRVAIRMLSLRRPAASGRTAPRAAGEPEATRGASSDCSPGQHPCARARPPVRHPSNIR
jgi:hypothetical protein